MDDAKLIDEYLQWRAVRELTPPDLSPQAFMEERVRDMAIDRLESVADLVDAMMKDQTITGRAYEVLLDIKDAIDGREIGDEEASTEPVAEEPGTDQVSGDDPELLLPPSERQH